MDFQTLIRHKREGREHNPEEIEYLINAIAQSLVPDYQISAWAMAVCWQGMSVNETVSLAEAMARSGEIIDLSAITGVKVDKHSSGGVGDKTTLVVVPLVAAAGIPVPKMSGRGLGHTGGTIDKLEAIPGFRAEMTRQNFIAQVNRVGAAIIASSQDLVPADKKLYAIRDVTATVDSIPLIASSIMSKKLASGADALVLDVKLGRGAFIQNESEALELARTMMAIGERAGRRVAAVISNMNQPLGKMVGNSLEVEEAIAALHGQGPRDLEELSLTIAAQMAVLGDKGLDFPAAWKQMNLLLHNGAAWEKFVEWLTAQGGSLDQEWAHWGLPSAKIKQEVKTVCAGYISGLDALQVGLAAMSLGAGRVRQNDNIDLAVGIELVKKVGDKVDVGDILAIVHANETGKAEAAAKAVALAYDFSDKLTLPDPLIVNILQ